MSGHGKSIFCLTCRTVACNLWRLALSTSMRKACVLVSRDKWFNREFSATISEWVIFTVGFSEGNISSNNDPSGKRSGRAGSMGKLNKLL